MFKIIFSNTIGRFHFYGQHFIPSAHNEIDLFFIIGSIMKNIYPVLRKSYMGTLQYITMYISWHFL